MPAAKSPLFPLPLQAVLARSTSFRRSLREHCTATELSRHGGWRGFIGHFLLDNVPRSPALYFTGRRDRHNSLFRGNELSRDFCGSGAIVTRDDCTHHGEKGVICGCWHKSRFCLRLIVIVRYALGIVPAPGEYLRCSEFQECALHHRNAPRLMIALYSYCAPQARSEEKCYSVILKHDRGSVYLLCKNRINGARASVIMFTGDGRRIPMNY